ncbi:MAG: prepilin-type N-terminal cleavage/methylation domain-containing protein [Candidatus Levyibacteriota bacterium]|nr:MAG: prepilin-type N-terminal cleavage/methylation domain-containing protein [Candidatus Levybacteria bacterium]
MESNSKFKMQNLLKTIRYTLPAIRLQTGFTLIELLAAMAVIGVLGISAFVYFDPLAQMQKANDNIRKSDLEQMQKALEQYHKDNSSYPLSTAKEDKLPYRIKGFKADHQIIDWGEEWSPYMAVLPKDTDTRRYVYYASSNGQAYWLYASLERGGANPQASLKFNNIDSSACGKICNYAVSSPNVSP